MTDLRERVAHEIHLSKWWTGGEHKARRCATRILALFAAERERMREALEAHRAYYNAVQRDWGDMMEGVEDVVARIERANAALALKEEPK